MKGILPSTEDWDTIQTITSTLSHFAKLTIVMQKETVSLSDFFGGWAKIKMELTKLENQLAKQLLVDMKKREPDLFNNQALNAAVFLDPRFQMFMPSQNKDQAVEFLSKLHKKMETLQQHDTTNTANTTEADELEEFMKNSMYSHITEDEINNSDNESTAEECSSVVEDIKSKLTKFIGVKEPISSSVFEYWQRQMHIQPDLYKLATIVHSVPPTQCTVERSFSAMALLLSPLRTNLLDLILENMLIVRLNRDDFAYACEFNI